MKKTLLLVCFLGSNLMVLLPVHTKAQANPFLKKYAGSYYVLAFGEEQPQANSEKIVFIADGTWSSVSFPKDKDEVPSKVPMKRVGKWSATESVIKRLSATDPKEIEYQLQDGLFMSADTYLQLIFISDPVYLKKYATAYHLLFDSEDKPGALTATFRLNATGSCTIVQPLMDENGNVLATPKSETTTWKARAGVIQINLKDDEGKDKVTEFTSSKDVFHGRDDSFLKKVQPQPPPNQYLKLYSGTYHMLADGVVPNKETDLYVFTPNGKVVWTYFTAINPDGSVTKAAVAKEGTWTASEGLIHMDFDMGSFDMGSEKLISDFRLKNGVFRNEGIFLKRVPK